MLYLVGHVTQLLEICVVSGCVGVLHNYSNFKMSVAVVFTKTPVP